MIYWILMKFDNAEITRYEVPEESLVSLKSMIDNIPISINGTPAMPKSLLAVTMNELSTASRPIFDLKPVQGFVSYGGLNRVNGYRVDFMDTANERVPRVFVSGQGKTLALYLRPCSE